MGKSQELFSPEFIISLIDPSPSQMDYYSNKDHKSIQICILKK